MKSLRLASLLISAALGAALAGPAIGNMVGDVTEPTECATTDPTCAPEVTEDPADEPTEPAEPVEEETSENEDTADNPIVELVAHCAPHGKDAKALALGTHGSFVSAAAHGATVTVNDTDYDLSTMEGAQALCAAFGELQAQSSGASEPKHAKSDAHQSTHKPEKAEARRGKKTPDDEV